MECEVLLERLGPAGSCEEDSRKALDSFVQANQANFNIVVSTQCKEKLCQVLLEQCDQSDPPKWSHDTVAVSLSVLRILARQMNGCGPIVSEGGLSTLSSLAGLSGQGTLRGVVKPELTVMVEAVKCLCNIVLKNHELSTVCERVGILKGLTHHLTSLHSSPSHYELVYYDLRLLFLITACDADQRVSFRDDHNGVASLLQLMDSLLFPASSSEVVASCPLRDSVVLLPCRLEDRLSDMVCEVLKILFNQTVQQAEEIEEATLQSLVYLIRVILTSVPAHLSNATMTIVSHCAEVLLNMPPSTASCLLLPESAVTTPTLHQWYPGLYDGVQQATICTDIDTVFDGYNMAAIVNLLNYLQVLLCDKKSRNLNAVLASLRQVSKGHRVIRRYLKSQILPPLGVVSHRPEQGDTLKSRLVRLMLPGNHGAEEVAAELLFVLCKEDGTRLAKHTGYGNAAGLLMAHGLLGGGRGEGAELYSSDSEDSDTEEYVRTKDNIDPVTGGPAPGGGDGRSPLDDMTEEEKEREAEQLHHLIEKMNAQGIIKMVSVNNKDQPPLDHSSSSDDD